MATNKEKAGSSVFLDTTSAQFALDKLNAKISAYDKQLKQTNLTQRELASLQKSRTDAAEKAGAIQLQIEKGIGATLIQQRKYIADLTKEMSNLSVGTQAWIDKGKQIDAANATLAEMKARQAAITGAVGETTKATGFWGKNLDNIKSFFIGGGLLALAGRALSGTKGFFKDAFDEALQAEEKTARLHNTLDNLGRTDVFDRLIAKGKELAAKFKFIDNDDVTGVFEHLIDFGKLTEKQMNDLLPVIINFASKQRVSLDEAATTITKFVETGKGLKGFGLDVKDAKTEAERLAIVMGDLKTKTEGAADAFGDTTSGKLAQAKQQFKDLKEEIGTGIIPIINKLLSVVNDAIKGLKFFGNAIKDALSGKSIKASVAENIVDNTTTGQQAVQDNIRAYQAALQSQKNSLEELHKQGKLLNKTQADITTEFVTSIQKKLVEAQDKYNSLSQSGIKITKDELADAYSNLKALEQLSNQLVSSKGVIGTSDSLDNTDDAAAAKFKALLEKAEAFNKQLRDLQQQSEDASKSQNEKEIEDAKHKYDEILIAYRKLVKELSKSGIKLAFNEGDITKLESKELTGILARQQQELNDNLAKQRITAAEKEYQEALQLSDAFFEQQKQLQAQRFVDGEIDEKEYQSTVAAIDVKAKENQLLIAKDYAGQKITISVNGVRTEVALVKQADADLTKFKKENLQKQTADLLAEFAKREQLRKLFEELDKSTALGHAQAQVTIAAPGSQAQFEAQKKLAALQHNQRLLDIEKENEEILKAAGDNYDLREQANKDYNQKIADENDVFRKQQDDAERDHIIALVNQTLAYLQQALTIFSKFSEAKTSQERAELDRQQQLNDKHKSSYQKLLNNKLISSQEFNRRVAADDAALQKQKEEFDKKEFERKKKISILQALINGAQGVTKAIADYPFPFSLIPIAFAVGTTAAEIVSINKQKYEQGGFVPDGPSHKEKGIKLVDSKTGQVRGEVEGGEPILSKKTYANNKQVVDSLLNSSMNKSGATINPFYKNTPYKSFDTAGVTRTIQRVRHFENGGIIQPPVSSTQPSAQPDPLIVPAMTDTQEQLLNALLNRLNKPIETFVHYGSIKIAKQKDDNLLDDTIFK